MKNSGQESSPKEHKILFFLTVGKVAAFGQPKTFEIQLFGSLIENYKTMKSYKMIDKSKNRSNLL